MWERTRGLHLLDGEVGAEERLGRPNGRVNHGRQLHGVHFTTACQSAAGRGTCLLPLTLSQDSCVFRSTDTNRIVWTSVKRLESLNEALHVNSAETWDSGMHGGRLYL